MNENELLDHQTVYGDKHLFLVHGDFLFIYKGKIEDNEYLRKIHVQNVVDLRYIKRKNGKSIGSIILEIIGAIASEGLMFDFATIYRNSVEIDYKVEGEVAKGSYNTTLQLGDLEELKELLKLSSTQ